MKEFEKKSNDELRTFVQEKRETMRTFRFGTAGSGMRNTKAQRDLRKDIARALTLLSSREREERKQLGN